MRARFTLTVLVFALLFGSATPSYTEPVPKVGAACKKVGTTKNYKGKVFTCKKSGKNLVWSTGRVIKQAAPVPVATASTSPIPKQSPAPVPIPSPTAGVQVTPSASPKPTPTPTSFENLYEARAGISYAAWKRTSEIIKNSKSKVGTLEIYTGPNTKPFFDNYPLALSLISRAFPDRREPGKILVIRFNYQDLRWADETLRQKLSTQDYEHINQAENGRQITGRCDDRSRNCVGAMQQSTFSGSDIALIVQGVPNMMDPYDPTGKARFLTGMLEAHEYFHALQRVPIMGKSNLWPHAWFREGGAEWIQNAAINFDDFPAYRDFIKADCSGQCMRISEAEIIEFLKSAKENYLPSKFDSWLNYALGSLVVETFVALKGPDSLIELYAQMATKIDFATAFKNMFGVDWEYAIPIIAKTVHANINNV
ncbi:MAG: hypothetical protein EBW41_05425 [Actinobacteria bacterium]|nr:hypothetical protein [Actinomycetota bacterium]NCV44159.1 hypothetical protein [Actinomycetota bacterium]NCV84108.1 hypothetical protein [Actinomycetota bacterium]NCW94281.1 hypothetical protein [Actinomycetota bacterium]NCW97169.1 hypothetical protein [Actinomycetota bacterium]